VRLIIGICFSVLLLAGAWYFYELLLTYKPTTPPTSQPTFPDSLNNHQNEPASPKYDEDYSYPEYTTDTLNIDSIFQANGLISVKDIDSSISVDLKYASTDNFMNRNVYGNLSKAYLRPKVARMLAKANQYLQEKYPHLRIVVYDAARPQRVQFTMWNLVVNTEHQKYVAPPIPGSLHNFGCSVDVSLIDTSGQALDMGTAYDEFDPKSEPRYEKKFIKSGDLTKEQIKNRRILREAMQSAGFIYMVKEWWHFDAYPPEQVVWKYKIIK
jgi:D-alanyl-D-alanine dipeptidase